ncbi:EAL domain-containing protein [Marinobacter sp. CHS3-4]|uniref:EAL domain-containing protein n=1 Tax=Marinobacter sp. CHS3-4 TaxID=3045174 RepID=UPI0024B503CE|nr:EAL domain-containing protein [Marinobacter sp. CHS3-4]MDI9245833.1 EAL domain-containing protein [Marinobacter sp. CHS3-4]
MAFSRLLAVLVLLWSGSTAVANAESALEIDPLKSEIEIVRGYQYLVEGNPSWSIDQVRNLSGSGRWQDLEGPPNFGYRSDAIWYRLEIDLNRSGQIQRFFEVTYPLLDHLELYHFAGNQKVFESFAGDRLPHENRPIDVRTFVFPLLLDDQRQHVLYLRVQTSGSHQLPAMLWEPDAFYRANEKDMMWRAMFYGMLLILAASTFYLAFTIREWSFGYFFAVQLCLLVIMTGLHGVAFQYLFPDRPRVHELLILASVPLGAMFFAMFSMAFLDLKRLMHGAYRVLQVMSALAFLAFVSGFVLTYGVSTRISVALSALMCVVILTIGLALAKRGDRAAKQFVMAWVALLLGVVFHVLGLSAVLAEEWVIPYAMETGSVLASLLLFFALADRLHTERSARIREQYARIEAMRAREAAEGKVVDAARHHGLTGLPNRVALEECLHTLMQGKGSSVRSFALVLLHLRGFDDINKTLGHENADAILTEVANRLDALVREQATHVLIESHSSRAFAAAHVEGVTFACVFSTTDSDSMSQVMSELGAGIRKPVDFRGLSVDLRVVGGCSFYPDDSPDVATLLRHAFIAFDRAASEADQMAVYTPDLNPYSERRLTLMTNLRKALENDELTLNFQPQLKVSTGEVSGFEALLRWQHPEHGFVPPDEFIPMAEQTGLIGPVTAWVLDKSLAFCRELEQAGYPVGVSVNISAVNLREAGFVEQVLSVLGRNQVEARRLILEVTETATMVDPKAALHCLRLLNESGIRLSIDDFGTGYSSLSYIRKLPVHEIKIDRSFVMEMDTNRGDETIVRTTINMCHDLGYEVVAEGIESQPICDLLSAMGCDTAQGYHLARPIPQQGVMDWIRAYYDSDNKRPFSEARPNPVDT